MRTWGSGRGVALLAALAILGSACTSATDIVAAESPLTTISPAAELSAASPSTTTPIPPVTETEASTAPLTASPERTPIVLGFGGDTTFTNGLEQRDPFGLVADLTSAPDLMVVNLETAVADVGVGSPPVEKAFLFRSPPSSLDLLVEAGVDVVALANNHTFDFGPDALAQTLAEIDARLLHRVGAGVDQASAYKPLIIDVGDWTIGLVSLSRVPCDWSASGENVRPHVAWVCTPFFDLAMAATEQALARADVTVVMIHGGEEGVLCPSAHMVELERVFAEVGVDAVINGHPHVLQGVTRHGDTWAAHSLGNFAFPPANGITGNSAIIQLTVSEDGVDLSIVPVRSDSGVLSRPSEAQRADIIGQMQRVSDGVTIDESGVATADATVVGDC